MPFLFRKLTKLQLIAFLMMVAVSVVAVAISVRKTNAPTVTAQDKTTQITLPVDTKAGFVSRARINPLLRDAMDALGDRLEKSGNERVVMVGTLSRKKDEKLAARLILEFPDKIRLEEPDGVTVCDGKTIKNSKKNRALKDDDEIESLLADSVEHFFSGQASGYATQFMGQRFRADDGTTADYTGPFYEPYLVQDPTILKKNQGNQPKLYLLNSDTLLLERVRYQDKNFKTKIEVQFSDWQKVNGQFVPGKIIRLEDGNIVTSFTSSKAAVGAKAADGIFDQP